MEKVVVFEDKANEWQWMKYAANGEELSKSTEGYVNKSYAIERACTDNPNVLVFVREEDGTETSVDHDPSADHDPPLNEDGC